MKEQDLLSSPPLHLNLCCSQQHQGLWFPIANEPVSAERPRYVRFICYNYEVLFLDVSLELQHFSQKSKVA